MLLPEYSIWCQFYGKKRINFLRNCFGSIPEPLGLKHCQSVTKRGFSLNYLWICVNTESIVPPGRHDLLNHTLSHSVQLALAWNFLLPLCWSLSTGTAKGWKTKYCLHCILSWNFPHQYYLSSPCESSLSVTCKQFSKFRNTDSFLFMYLDIYEN